jgi:hypothetical protein
MPANPVYNDGGADYGTAILTITPKGGGQSWTAICDGAFTLTYATRAVERRGQYGEPTGAFGIKETTTGRATIYLPASKKAAPGDTFTTDVTGTKVWIVTDVEEPYEADDWRKQTLTFREKLAAS